MKSTNIFAFWDCGLMMIVGIVAVAGGLGVILDPSGESLGVLSDSLIGSPFGRTSYSWNCLYSL